MDRKTSNLHLLATSRKENVIATFLEHLITCQLLVDADICVHVLERLSNDPKLKKWPIAIQKEIEDASIRGAKGIRVVSPSKIS